MTKRWMRRSLHAGTAVCVIAVSAASASASVDATRVLQANQTSFPGSRVTTLSKLLTTAMRRANSPGGVLLVKTPTSTWLRSAGLAELRRSYAAPAAKRVPMAATGRFRIGSVTKTFTAALVLELVADGRLTLDDTVERWLPGRLPDGAGTNITIRQLLQHRSGLQDTPLLSAGGILVAGPPGRFYYANANYTLLGEIVAAATRSTYEQQLQERILQPLGLTQTVVAQGPAAPSGLVHGYSPKPVKSGGLRIDETAWTDSTPPPAGSIVSSALDMARFERALFTAQIFSSQTVTLMQTPLPLDGFESAGYTAYGFGLMRFPASCGDAWGHRGRAPGYTAYMLSTADGSRTAVLLLNDGLLPDDTVAKINPLVERALCA